ncbi:MAG: glycosyltransferase [Candidatus Omnitrophica bacterium]|nr:glycosyltransferase [Candidatus Omnitrophota bacterium]
MKPKKIIIIGWQPLSRRSQTFACQIQAPLYLIHFFKFKFPLIAPIKYIFQALKTFWVLQRERPDFVIVENPPVFLPLIAFVYTRISGTHFIIDSATGAFLDPKWKWFNFLFKFLARKAFLNIATNDELCNMLKRWGARSFVLEDCIPDFPPTQSIKLKDGFSVTVINTFSFDEPIEEILLAAQRLQNVNFYITGNTIYAKKDILKNPPPNVTFTGYMDEPRPYFSLLRAADAIMVLCTVDNTLCAGMYEAVSVGKPLIASDWGVIRRFFNKGTVHVRNTSEDIIKGIMRLKNNTSRLEEEMAMLQKEARDNWRQKFSILLQMLEGV